MRSLDPENNNPQIIPSDMSLSIYNTLSGKKEPFIPIEKDKVGMYVCGPTVYDASHIGHARSVVVFDMIYRWLEQSGYQVTYVRNFTDVDDKIIKKSNETGMSCSDITEKYIAEFYAEMDQATNIFNRRAGLEKMSLLINKARTTKLNIGIIFVDVNGLKSVNDILGHQYGDQLIESAATIMKESIRQHDILFRYGGDEFIMCLEGLDSEGINNIWQRIKSKLDQINNNNELKFNISLSHGVSIIKGEDKNIDMNKYIEDADQKMYEEKIEIKKTAVIIKPPRSNL